MYKEDNLDKEDKYYASRIESFVDEALKCKIPFYKATYKNIKGEENSLLVNLKGTDNCLNEMIIRELLKPDKFEALLDFVCSEKKNYNEKRSCTFSLKKNKLTEKRLAICLYNYGSGTILGTPIHYETPLRKKDIGAIDLVYKTDKHINLVELKSGNSSERLLRAILELTTYYKNLNIKNFKKEFAFSDSLKFQFIILLEKETQAWQDAKNLKEKKLPNLKTFMKSISEKLDGIPIKVYEIKKLKNPQIIDVNGKKYLKNVDFKNIICDMQIEY